MEPKQIGDAEVEKIARVAYEANRAWCELLGDTSQTGWSVAPERQRDSMRNGVRFLWANPNAGPEASHECWLAQKVADGWTQGPHKSYEKKEHPDIAPFDRLPAAEQIKNFIFHGLCHAMFEALEL